MAEPKLVSKKQLTNQSISVPSSPKSPSQKSVKYFNSQSNLLKNSLPNSSRDDLANSLSNKSASNDSGFPKCSSSTGNKPCVVDSGYRDKRAYSGSGMAGWKEAGLAGNTNNQLSAGAGVTADVFIFGVGASGEVMKRNHGNLVCYDLSACGQIGIGLHVGAGAVIGAGVENIQPSKFNASVGGFGNLFSSGGAVTVSKGSISAAKGMLGVGAGASTGVQACATASVFCK